MQIPWRFCWTFSCFVDISKFTEATFRSENRGIKHQVSHPEIICAISSDEIKLNMHTDGGLKSYMHSISCIKEYWKFFAFNNKMQGLT